MKAHVLSGIDRIDTVAHLLQGKRVGLMTNPTGIDHHLKSTIDIVARRFNLTALFAVEHGIRGDLQNGQAFDHMVDPATGVTVYCVFGKDAHLTDEMLDTFDVLLFDIQDIGVRFYTYIFSMGYAMEACTRAGKSMIVLDRINPIGGLKTCGTILDPAHKSFVGDYELPSRYALTCGELALYIRDYLHLTLDLTVVPLQGWERWMYQDDTDVPWVIPSPNLPTLETALTYIGMCIFEGTNISEGRGTTQPFQIAGAPFLDGAKLESAMEGYDLPGIHFRRTSFCPSFHKYKGELCHGVQMHIINREICDPFAAGMILLDEIRKQAGEHFQIIPRFGYSADNAANPGAYKMDQLLGLNDYRLGLKTTAQILSEHAPRVAAFAKAAEKYHLYQ